MPATHSDLNEYMSVSGHRVPVNESLVNAAFVFITQESLDALKFVIKQLSQFYKTSDKVTVETVQYALDSTCKAAQKEWSRIKGMIQSEFERIIQETHAVERQRRKRSSSCRVFGSTEISGCSQRIKHAEKYDSEPED